MQAIFGSLTKLREGDSTVVGSSDHADLVVKSAKVDGRHAQISRLGTKFFIRDLDSAEGTFVNNQEVRGQVELRPGDIFRIGDVEFAVPGEPAAHRLSHTESDREGARLDVVDAVKRVRIRGSGEKAILDHVSITVQPGQFVGVLGASGSGKSTLMKAIAGIVGLTDGQIVINGQLAGGAQPPDATATAYLPQDVVIHEALTAAVALDFIAQLKKLSSTPADREALVIDALKKVGLADRATVPIQSLSGGQRKRVALAAELLGDPQLILLDEATSGLDPATETEMMTLFRSLADEGRTVLCITHFPGRLHLCDRLIYLIQGRCVFDGTPAELKEFFGIDSIEDVYGRQAERSIDEWQQLYRASAIRPSATAVPAMPRAAVVKPEIDRPMLEAVVDQARILTARYLRLQMADIKNLLLLFAQPPIIALMIATTFGSIKASFAELHAADTKQVAFVLVLAVLWCSGTISVREIVKEMPIMRHEQRFGVGLLPYLSSKVALLGAFALIQTLVLLLMVRHFTDLTGPATGQFLVLGMTAVAGAAVGLLVSAIAGTSERAMTILPVLLIGQAIFSGGLARLTGVTRAVSMAAVPAFWSLEGLKAQFSSDLANATYPGAPGHYQPPILGHGEPFSLDIVVLIGQTAILISLTLFALLRNSGHRTRG